MNKLNNLTTVRGDVSTNYFNNFFKPNFDVSQNLDEVVISFFEQIATNKISARAMAGAVIYTAKAQGLDPMEILNQFRNLTDEKLNMYLTMFLNLNRVGTSLLGLSNAPITSKYIKRSILI